jgi:Zn finger protein HypA/HybF involved in hydrogenase expression
MYFHCHQCCVYFADERRAQEENRLSLHRCGSPAIRVSDAESANLARLALNADRRKLERVYRCF